MAVAKDWFGQVKGAIKESEALAKADKKQRLEAEKNPQSIIFNTNDLHGNYDIERALKTTIGGTPRVITKEDLIAFRRNVETLKTNKKLTGKGITARQVINLADVIVSGDETDLKRANREIHFARPYNFNNGVIRFFTNAGPKSKVSRHNVSVEFLDFKDAAKGSGQNIQKLALELCRKPLRFDCDCGRHRYWFRYIATIGEFNLGRDEFGYPKIRNPHLAGVACKHVLRVMAEIESGVSVAKLLMQNIEKAIKSGNARAATQLTQKELEAQANQKRTIKTTTERENDTNKTKEKRQAEQARKAAKAALDKIPPLKKPRKTTKAQIQNLLEEVKDLKKEAELSKETKDSLSALSPEQIAAAIAHLQSLQNNMK